MKCTEEGSNFQSKIIGHGSASPALTGTCGIAAHSSDKLKSLSVVDGESLSKHKEVETSTTNRFVIDECL